MRGFLSAIDLSDNLGRSLQAIRGIRGIHAYILSIALLIICIALWPLLWYFDIESTLQWTDRAAKQLAPTLGPSLIEYLDWFTLAITILPTMIELFGSRFARVGIRMAGILVYALSLFDMITDRPRAWAFVESYQDALVGLGAFQGPVELMLKVLFLFLSSFGFELLFIIFAITAIALLMQGALGPSPTRREEVIYED